MTNRTEGRGRKAAASSDWARLSSRPLPWFDYPMLVNDPAPAQAALQSTVARARQIMLRHDPDTEEYRQAEADIGQATAAVEACYVRIRLTALEPEAYEALVDEHPPTPEQVAVQEPWNIGTFRPALLAACATVGGARKTPAAWAKFLAGHVSTGERQGLWTAVLGVNASARAVDSFALPKGSTQTLS